MHILTHIIMGPLHRLSMAMPIPRTVVGLTTEITEDTERVKAGPGPVPSVLSVFSVVQYRTQGRCLPAGGIGLS